jgi:hypothetical protein
LAGIAEHVWRGGLLISLAVCAIMLHWVKAPPQSDSYWVAAPPPAERPDPLPLGREGVRLETDEAVKRRPTAAELARDRLRELRRSFVRDVAGFSVASRYRRFVRRDLGKRLLAEGVELRRSQWVAYVDRNPRRPGLLLWYYDRPADRFFPVGGAPVAIGAPFAPPDAGNPDPHFLTPTGVFPNSVQYGDYQARSVAGRVFDFGRTRSATWRRDAAGERVARRTVQFQAHVGEAVGRAASHGCIRMNPDLNRFLHRQGVWDRPLAGTWKWHLVHDQGPGELDDLAGQYLVVGDSCLDFQACGKRYRGLLARLGHQPVGGAPEPDVAAAVAKR